MEEAYKDAEDAAAAAAAADADDDAKIAEDEAGGEILVLNCPLSDH